MMSIIFSTICFVLSIYQIMNGSDIGGIILMVSSIIWFSLYLVAININNNSMIRKAIVGSSIKKEENKYEFS